MSAAPTSSWVWVGSIAGRRSSWSPLRCGVPSRCWSSPGCSARSTPDGAAGRHGRESAPCRGAAGGSAAAAASTRLDLDDVVDPYRHDSAGLRRVLHRHPHRGRHHRRPSRPSLGIGLHVVGHGVVAGAPWPAASSAPRRRHRCSARRANARTGRPGPGSRRCRTA